MTDMIKLIGAELPQVVLYLTIGYAMIRQNMKVLTLRLDKLENGTVSTTNCRLTHLNTETQFKNINNRLDKIDIKLDRLLLK
jgi:hypothetical protein